MKPARFHHGWAQKWRLANLRMLLLFLQQLLLQLLDRVVANKHRKEELPADLAHTKSNLDGKDGTICARTEAGKIEGNLGRPRAKNPYRTKRHGHMRETKIATPERTAFASSAILSLIFFERRKFSRAVYMACTSATHGRGFRTKVKGRGEFLSVESSIGCRKGDDGMKTRNTQEEPYLLHSASLQCACQQPCSAPS